MTWFITGMVERNEACDTDGKTVYTRELLLDVGSGFHIPVFDQHLLSTELKVGKSYEMVLALGPASELQLVTSSLPGGPRSTGLSTTGHSLSQDVITQAQILDTHWWFPESMRAFLLPDSASRSSVLLETSVGRLVKSREYLVRRLGAIQTGLALTWRRARLDLVAINGLPYPKSRGNVQRLWPNTSALEMIGPKALSPELEDQLRQHRVWIESEGAQGRQLKLRRGDLRGLSLQSVQLHKASLIQGMFSGSDLRRSDLSQALLGDAIFLGTQLDEASLESADGAEAIFRGASLVHIQANKALFEAADFSGANARQAQFTRAELAGARFEETHLEDADLRDSNLASAYLGGALLTGARLHGAFLEGADGIDLVRADWILVGDETAPQRLEGTAARQWLHEAARRKVRVEDS